MCGIIAKINGHEVAASLLAGLRRLEYRGYDSAGIAVIKDRRLERRRAAGKIANLEALMSESPVDGRVGIAHTRWATHGAATEANAHPHMTERVAVVHNGIIENHGDLRRELIRFDHHFESETDSEVIPRLISEQLDVGLMPLEAVIAATKRLKGSYALVAAFAESPDTLVAARRGSPLVVGVGDNEMTVASDRTALPQETHSVIELEEGDVAEIQGGDLIVRDHEGQTVQRLPQPHGRSFVDNGKDGYPHYMAKEMQEQPAVVAATLMDHLDPRNGALEIASLPFDPRALSRLDIVACGTSCNAGRVARYWIERMAALPVNVEIASEFRYRDVAFPAESASIFISQSGETADTLAALRTAKARGQPTLSIVNVADSCLAREADATLLTRAGPEIGVASTKAFTTQLTLLAVLAITLAKARGRSRLIEEQQYAAALCDVPTLMEKVLHLDRRMREVAQQIQHARSAIFLGRGSSLPVALEGALKLKEISYIHAEGLSAGEMKHGPIALIDENMPVIFIAPGDELFEKNLSNAQEAAARGGRIILITDPSGIMMVGENDFDELVVLPRVDPFIAPLLYVLPLQQLAYHTADLVGADIDQPRNLAKAVTVE